MLSTTQPTRDDQDKLAARSRKPAANFSNPFPKSAAHQLNTFYIAVKRSSREQQSGRVVSYDYFSMNEGGKDRRMDGRIGGWMEGRRCIL